MWLLKCDQNSVIKFEVRFSGSPATWQVCSSHAWLVAAILDGAEPRHSSLLQKGLWVELVPTETECYQKRNIIWNVIWALKKPYSVLHGHQETLKCQTRSLCI